MKAEKGRITIDILSSDKCSSATVEIENVKGIDMIYVLGDIIQKLAKDLDMDVDEVLLTILANME